MATAHEFTARSDTYFTFLPGTGMRKLSVEWVQGILRREGLKGWTCRVVKGHGAYCWREQRRIDVADMYSNAAWLWLHEIAHALSGPMLRLDGTRGDQHGWQWWRMFEYLVNEYTTACFKNIHRPRRVPGIRPRLAMSRAKSTRAR